MPLNNSQYDAVMRDYDRKRSANLRIQADRRQHIYNTLPRIKEIDDTISSEFRKASMLRISGNREAVAEFDAKRTKLAEERSALLIQNNYPADYLDDIFDCKLCKDTGYIGTERCQCLKHAITNFLYDNSRIRDRLEAENFDALSMEYYSRERQIPGRDRTEYENMEHIVNAAHSFVDNFDEVKDNLLFFGQVGCGKTFMTNCIAKALLDKRFSVIYLSAAELFKKLADAQFRSEDEELPISQYVDDCDLLIVDDLGTEMSNEFTNSAFFSIINNRVQARRPTLISTNLGLSGIRDRYSDRIYSRIVGSFRIFQFFGDDIRIKKKLR